MTVSSASQSTGPCEDDAGADPVAVVDRRLDEADAPVPNTPAALPMCAAFGIASAGAYRIGWYFSTRPTALSRISIELDAGLREAAPLPNTWRHSRH